MGNVTPRRRLRPKATKTTGQIIKDTFTLEGNKSYVRLKAKVNPRRKAKVNPRRKAKTNTPGGFLKPNPNKRA